MKKRIISILLAAVIAAAAVGCVYFIIRQKNSEDLNVSVTVNEINENSYAAYTKNTIVLQGENGSYYQVKEDGLYLFAEESSSFEDKVIDRSGVTLAQYGGGFFVLSDGHSVYVYDSLYKPVSRKQTDGKIENIFIANDSLYVKCTYEDQSAAILQYSVLDLTVEQKSYAAQSSSEYTFTESDNCQTIVSRENNSIAAICKNGSFMFGTVPLFVYDNCVYQIRRDDNADGETIQIIGSGKTERFDTPHSKAPARNIMLCGDVLLILGVQSGRGDESYSSDLNTHQYDVLTVYDMKDKEAKNFKTKKGEKIVYADEDNIITYYKNSCITYSIADFKKIKEKTMDKIKSGGSYTFETCKDFIFVFDKSNELVERISVGG